MVVVVMMIEEKEEHMERMKRNELIEEECKKLLIDTVFLRLPPPSVARFKSISKWWRRYLSEPPFVDRYEARNLSILGFFYQTNYNKFIFRAIPSNPNDKSSSSISISIGNHLRTDFESHIRASDNTLLVINSFHGLLLLYSSMPVPYYEVYNPTTSDKVSVRFSYNYETFATRYMVFGFAFDPHSTHPYFTIVDIADTGAYLPSNNASFAFLFNAVKQLQADPLAITEDTYAHPKANMFLARAKSIVRCLKDDGLIHLYSQLGICQVAGKCFPHLQYVEFDPTGIPVWSFYNLHAALTFIGLRVVKYNDFIQVEGCLYGCTTKRAMGGHSASKSVEEPHHQSE